MGAWESHCRSRKAIESGINAGCIPMQPAPYCHSSPWPRACFCWSRPASSASIEGLYQVMHLWGVSPTKCSVTFFIFLPRRQRFGDGAELRACAQRGRSRFAIDADHADHDRGILHRSARAHRAHVDAVEATQGSDTSRFPSPPTAGRATRFRRGSVTRRLGLSDFSTAQLGADIL